MLWMCCERDMHYICLIKRPQSSHTQIYTLTHTHTPHIVNKIMSVAWPIDASMYRYCVDEIDNIMKWRYVIGFIWFDWLQYCCNPFSRFNRYFRYKANNERMFYENLKIIQTTCKVTPMLFFCGYTVEINKYR